MASPSKKHPTPRTMTHALIDDACATITNSVATAIKYPNGVFQLNGNLDEELKLL